MPQPAGDLASVRTSATHRTGGRRDPALVDPPVYWQLGNTPFDRESRYRELLADPLPAGQGEALEHAVRGSWAWGSSAFLEAAAGRPPADPPPHGRAGGPGAAVDGRRAGGRVGTARALRQSDPDECRTAFETYVTNQ